MYMIWRKPICAQVLLPMGKTNMAQLTSFLQAAQRREKVADLVGVNLEDNDGEELKAVAAMLHHMVLTKTAKLSLLVRHVKGARILSGLGPVGTTPNSCVSSCL